MSSRAGKFIAVGVVLALVAGIVVKVVFLDRERVLLVGDSIMHQTGPALDDTFGFHTQIDNEGVNNSGLLDTEPVDWHRKLSNELDDGAPAVLVFLFIGNYAGTDPAKNTPEFFDAWGQAADRLMQVVKEKAPDTEVFWVLPPPQLSPENQATTAGLRQAYTDLADRWPAIHLIDANQALAGPNGEYLPQATNARGVTVPLRTGDSVHLTEAGARRLARLIHDQIAPYL